LAKSVKLFVTIGIELLRLLKVLTLPPNVLPGTPPVPTAFKVTAEAITGAYKTMFWFIAAVAEPGVMRLPKLSEFALVPPALTILMLPSEVALIAPSGFRETCHSVEPDVRLTLLPKNDN
jgi:hypothetical protein